MRRRSTGDLMTSRSDGRKDDSGKPRATLVPWEAMRQAILALEHGAAKYGVDNWRTVPNARSRYMDAAHRHWEDLVDGPSLDDESGLSHAAHAVCCLLFVLWFDMNNTE